MATVNDILDNFDGPNYHGAVHQLTPSDCPFSSMLGLSAMGGGEIDAARTFEWQTYDLRSAAQNVVEDAAASPDEENRSRSNVFNVIQTHLEAIGVGYERQAQVLQFDGQNIGGGNPITDELSWQRMQMLKQLKRDWEFSLIQGTYNLAATNATNDASTTRGLVAAVSTNEVNATEDFNTVTVTNATNLFTLASHGFTNGDTVEFGGTTMPTGITEGQGYFVIGVDGNDFQVSLTAGGSAVTFSDDGTSVTVAARKMLDEILLEDAMQDAWDQGGLQEGDGRVLLIPSVHKRQLAKALRAINVEPRTRSVLGVNVQTVETSFGDLNLALSRHTPAGTVVAVSLEQCKPHHRVIPGKGITFFEPLAKDGARDREQLYGSIGLEYGNEEAHAKVTHLSLSNPTS